MPLATVTTTFFGICTHFAFGGNEEGPELYRVVLPDASNVDIINNSRLFGLQPPVQPHFARLQLRVQDIVSTTDIQTSGFEVFRVISDEQGEVAVIWNLNNVIISLANAQPGRITVDTDGLPHLGELCDNLGPASAIMTFNAVPTRAAAYVDFTSGTATCASFGVLGDAACVGVVTNTTIGLPQLRVKSFVDDKVISFTLTDGAKITFSNEPDDPESDDLNDFLIHFLNAAAFPEGAHPPDGCTCPPLFPARYRPTIRQDNIPFNAGPETTTPSCSNSTFP